VAGEAAHLLLNAGRAIQGMDYAMRSGILAAETVLEARQRADFTAASLRSYRTRLEQSYVLKDMNTFQNAVRLLHDPVMHDKLPALLCDFGRRIFTIDNQPMAKASQLMKQSIRAHSSYWEMGKLLLSAYRSL
jgi:electron transfer flavoprotein-quinone oxidoreductase